MIKLDKIKMVLGAFLWLVIAIIPEATAGQTAPPGKIKQEAWQELRRDDEIFLLRQLPSASRQGQIIAQKDKTTAVIMADDLGSVGEAAGDEFARYFPVACTCRIDKLNWPVKSIKSDYVLLLATVDSTELLEWAGLSVHNQEVPENGCLFVPVEKFPGGAGGLAIIGRHRRGLLNGCYTLMEKTMGLWWDPPRVYGNEKMIPETTLTQSEKVIWKGGVVPWQPVIIDRCYNGAMTKEIIDWCSRNRIDIFIYNLPTLVPIPEPEENRVRPLVRYAQDRGLKVVFLNMTHLLPDNRLLLSSSPEAIALSTRLYLEQFQCFGLDGMAWHTASENITLNIDEAYKKRPRAEWEAIYFNAYYQAIKAVKKDAMLGMLMGWAYMNPADKIASLVPSDTIAYVVPSSGIIDDSDTDLDAYDKNFKRVWYWLYSSVTPDMQYPMVKVDYMEQYCREAIRRGHGLAPQTGFCYHPSNQMYLAQVGRDSLVSAERFLTEYGSRYYGDAAMGQALIDYQEALKAHRSWYHNIHSRPGPQLNTQEVILLKDVWQKVLACARRTSSGLLRDRLKVLGVTTLRCLDRRAQRSAPGKPPQEDQISSEELAGFVDQAKEVFKDHYFGEPNDFFWSELGKIQGR